MASFDSDERQLLQESLTDYFRNQYSFEHFRALSAPDHEDGFGRNDWAQYAALGWLGVSLPESAGGSECGMTELAIIMAAAGAALALEPLLSTIVIGARAIELTGTDAQKALLAEVATGDHTLAFCHSEPDSGYARHYVTSVAEKRAQSYVLNGKKSYALHADAADSLIISARIGSNDGPVGLFLLSRDSSGLELTASPALDGRRGAAVSLHDVTVDASALLGETETDQSGAIDALCDRAAIALCAEAAGAMTAVTDQTVAYLQTREQFGQPLSKFQVLQHRMVDMSIAAEEARAATHAALNALDGGQANAQLLILARESSNRQIGAFCRQPSHPVARWNGHDRRTRDRPLLQAPNLVRDLLRRCRLVLKAARGHVAKQLHVESFSEFNGSSASKDGTTLGFVDSLLQSLCLDQAVATRRVGAAVAHNTAITLYCR